MYYIVKGDEEMFEVGENFAFHWVWRPLVFVVPAGMVHSPHHTNKGPTRLRVCVIRMPVPCGSVGHGGCDVTNRARRNNGK